MARVYIRTPRSNLAAVLKHGVYGFVRRSEAASVELDDYFILYGKQPTAKYPRKSEYRVVGMVKVASGPFEDRTPIYVEGGLYPYRVKVVPVKIFNREDGPLLDEERRKELTAAARDVWRDYKGPSWANFQRFNQPLPPSLAVKFLDWLKKADGIDTPEGIALFANNLPAPEPEAIDQAPDPEVSQDETLEEVRDDENQNETEVRAHSRVQWLLASIAAKAELDVWVARNDHRKMTSEGPLSEFSLSEFPDLPLPSDAVKPAKLIDILWIDGERIPAAFEVEYSTNVSSGLLRLSDLAFSLGSSTVRLCIVAPQSRFEKVKSEIQRPSFRMAFDPKKERHCYFLSFEVLEKVAKSIVSLPDTVHIQAPRLEDIAVDLLVR